MKTENYWFALRSYVYVEFKEKEMLLYDTQDGNRVETTLKGSIELIARLYDPQNLGVISVDDEMRTELAVWHFIQEVVNKKMGDLMEVGQYSQKPIRLVPILNLQKDIDKHKKNKNKMVFLGKGIGKYLLEMNVYLNDICGESCKHCDKYSKQIHCCMANGAKKELPIEDLRKIAEQLRYLSASTINLLGGDIFKYSHFTELEKLFAQYPKMLHCYVNYKNYQKNGFVDSHKLELIITFPIDDDLFSKVYASVNKENTKLHYIIENEDQYLYAEFLNDKYCIENYEIYPCFTGENIDFFKGNVFLNEEDVFFKTLQMREIFRNRKLNSNFFGTLYVLPDGAIKANMNTSNLGNIVSDDFLSIIYKELIENTAWRVIRADHPCDECIYQFICPPPSDYERFIGCTNLCHVKNR